MQIELVERKFPLVGYYILHFLTFFGLENPIFVFFFLLACMLLSHIQSELNHIYVNLISNISKYLHKVQRSLTI